MDTEAWKLIFSDIIPPFLDSLSQQSKREESKKAPNEKMLQKLHSLAVQTVSRFFNYLLESPIKEEELETFFSQFLEKNMPKCSKFSIEKFYKALLVTIKDFIEK